MDPQFSLSEWVILISSWLHISQSIVGHMMCIWTRPLGGGCFKNSHGAGTSVNPFSSWSRDKSAETCEMDSVFPSWWPRSGPVAPFVSIGMFFLLITCGWYLPDLCLIWGALYFWYFWICHCSPPRDVSALGPSFWISDWTWYSTGEFQALQLIVLVYGVVVVD